MHNYLKKTLVTILLTSIFSGWSSFALSLPASGDSLQYEILLSSKMLDSIHLDKRFINKVDITSSRLILLSANDQFYMLGWGGIIPLGKKITGKINSYAITSDGLLLAINNNELCAFDSLGNLSMLYKLPREGMGISTGKNGMFVYDQNEDYQINMLYVLAKGGKFAPLLSIATSIKSVVDMNDSILFASGNAVYSYKFENKKMNALIAMTEENKIKSVTVDTSENRIYFSTKNMVFALKDSKAVLITDKFGGELMYFNNGLIVFDHVKKVLIRILGLEGTIVPNH